MFAARVAELVVTSSDDADRFRSAIGDALGSWNNANARRRKIVLLPAGQYHPGTDAEGRDRSETSAQTVDCGDVFIAVFDPLRRDDARLMSDLKRAKGTGKLVFAWLLTEPPSSGRGEHGQAGLNDLTQQLMKEGITPRYLGHGDTQLESRLSTAIMSDLTDCDLSALATGFDRRVAARQVRVYRMPVGLLGPQIWAVTVVNHSNSLIVGLQVSVTAVDPQGRDLPDGVTRSTQAIADVIAKLRTGPWPDEHHPLRDPNGPLPAHQPYFLTSRLDLMAAHNAVDFPRWLRPNQHASALYSMSPGASPLVRIQFEDEHCEVWSRTNDAEPESVPSVSPDRRKFV